MHYSMPSFLNETVFHYRIKVFVTRAVYNQTRNSLLVGYCTTCIVVKPYFHTKRLKRDQKKRLTVCAGLRNKHFEDTGQSPCTYILLFVFLALNYEAVSFTLNSSAAQMVGRRYLILSSLAVATLEHSVHLHA
jgi:hypothetical protein